MAGRGRGRGNIFNFGDLEQPGPSSGTSEFPPLQATTLPFPKNKVNYTYGNPLYQVEQAEAIDPALELMLLTRCRDNIRKHYEVREEKNHLQIETERYTDRYRPKQEKQRPNYYWPHFPEELWPASVERTMRKELSDSSNNPSNKRQKLDSTSNVRDTETIMNRLNELDRLENAQSDVNEPMEAEVEKVAESQEEVEKNDRDGNVEGEENGEMDDEYDSDNDYTKDYFDNGEDYVCDENDALEDGSSY